MPPSAAADALSRSRLVGGAICDVVEGPGGMRTEVRLARCPSGWQATFEVTSPDVPDVAVVHRLVAPTLAEAKVAVPQAIAFLLGTPID